MANQPSWRIGICALGVAAVAACGDPTGVSVPTRLAAARLAIPITGLVGEWRLDESGGINAKDSRNDLDATVQGQAAFVPGHLGNGLNLNNGTTGIGGKYAEMPGGGILDAVQEGSYTISAWFYPTTVPPDAGADSRAWAIVVKAGQHMGLVYGSGGRFSMRHYLAGDVLEQAQSASSSPTGSWHHVAGVVDKPAGAVRLYVDGALQATENFRPNAVARDYGSTRFRIGKTATSWAANGKVDQVRIYGVALDPSQIVALYGESAPSRFRFPVGMSKGPQLELLGMPYTPDGHLGAGSVTSINQTLAAARARGARVTLRVTGGNGDFQTNGDRVFVIDKWKAQFDSVRSADPTGYLTDGTLLGHYAIDEPFSDFDNMTGATLDSLCHIQKRAPGWERVPCIVRELNTRLYANRPAGGVYRYVDAGWAQIADHQYVGDRRYDGDIGAYFRDNLAKGMLSGVGLMYGFNLLEGGRQFVGCAKPDGIDHNCAMRAAEIRELADTLAAIGDNQGCGVIGWRINSEPGAERDYFFSKGVYADSGIQSAMQYLSTKMGRVQPALCGNP